MLNRIAVSDVVIRFQICIFDILNTAYKQVASTLGEL